MIVRWTQYAANDMLNIRKFIARDSLHFADAFTDRVFERIAQIEEFPESGQIVGEYGRDDIRELLAYSYRVIYQKLESHCCILAVIHGAKPLPGAPPMSENAG